MTTLPAIPSERAPRRRCEIAGCPVAFLFTDLSNSTALYERLGDAAAYDVVRQHFASLSDLVFDHGGTVVKTIGDAMMAAFDDPFDAVAVALTVQARIAHFDRAKAKGGHHRRIAVRLGVHAGGCVRVERDHRVDYFGSTVNLAARLRGRSRNGDIVLSHDVAGRPGISQLLATLPTREESLPFRGIRGLVRFVRVLPSIQQVIGSGSVPAPQSDSSETPPGAFFALGGH